MSKNDYIEIENLPDYLATEINSKGTTQTAKDNSVRFKEIERDYINKALEKNNWSRKATAASLGIHPTTLWRKIKQLHIDIPHQDGRSKSS